MSDPKKEYYVLVALPPPTEEQRAQTIADCREAVRSSPDSAEAHAGLAEALASAGHVEEAAPAFREAVRLDPGNVERLLQFNRVLTRLWWSAGEPESAWGSEAIAVVRNAVALAPDRAEAHRELGYHLLHAGRIEEGVQECCRAIRLDPGLRGWDPGGLLKHSGGMGEVAAVFRELVRASPADPELRGSLATALIAAGRPDDGLEEYREAVRLEPRSLKWRFALANALEECERSTEMIAAYRAAVQLSPDNASVRGRLGRALILAGRIDEGLAVYKEALRRDPSVLEVFHDPTDGNSHHGRDLAARLARIGRLDDVIALYQEAVHLAPGDERLRIGLADALERANRSAEAAAEYREAMRINPSWPGLSTHLSRRYGLPNQQDDEIAALRERVLREPDPRHLERFFALAQALEQADRMPEALEVYRQAVSLNPEDPTGHARLGDALIRSHSPKEGGQEYEAAIRLDPEARAVRKSFPYGDHWRCQMAASLWQVGQTEAAIQQYRLGLHHEAPDSEARRSLARLLDETGRTEEAIAAYREFLHLAPHAPGLPYELGEVMHRAGRSEEWLAELRDASRQAPAKLDRHEVMGHFLHMAGRLDEALAAYRECMRLDPAAMDPRGEIGLLLEKLGREEEAMAEYRELIRLVPDTRLLRATDPSLAPRRNIAHHRLGVLLRKRASYEESLLHLREAVRLDAEGGEAPYELGLTLNEMSRRAEARAAWERALVLGHEEVAEQARRMLAAFPPVGEG